MVGMVLLIVIIQQTQDTALAFMVAQVAQQVRIAQCQKDIVLKLGGLPGCGPDADGDSDTASPHSTVPEGYSALTGFEQDVDGSGSDGGDVPDENTTTPEYQTPTNPDDYHCDINSYNVAVDQGIQNPGTWDGNELSVNEIYTQYYGNGSETPEVGTQGYGFYDNNGDGSYDHMFYYSYAGGNTYHVWNSNGIDPVTETDWSINGSAVEKSVFVPLY